VELTTVADDFAVVHDDFDVRVYDGLEPDHFYEYDGFPFRTLPRPPGEHLSTFATVNDVHFGETDCGIIEGLDIGPIFRVQEGEEPYPITMNRAAIQEMSQRDFATLVVKGDLTSKGTFEEYNDFLEHYQGAFGDRLVHVRGNHDAYYGNTFADDAPRAVELPGVTLAVIDTTIPAAASGRVTGETLAWLDELASDSDQSILVFGHHHVWSPESPNRPASYFGINPDDSERLIELVAARPSIIGYFAGHTHRNRVRRFSVSGDVPWVEVACVKDFPGAWAEYRVYEGGVLQVFHRISTPDALVWTQQTREMYDGTYFEYSFGELRDRCFPIWPRG
jgi:3',5'-cyclic-AMP phosphodiesterase